MDDKYANPEVATSQSTASVLASGDGRRALTTGARPKQAKRRPPSMSEIAQIILESGGVEHRTIEKEVVRGDGLFSRGRIETISESARMHVCRFRAIATGPAGRYTAGTSPTFPTGSPDGTLPSHRVGRTYLWSQYVEERADAEAALNSLIGQFWADGWQPVSSGPIWHDIKFRRLVAGPRRNRTADEED